MSIVLTKILFYQELAYLACILLNLEECFKVKIVSHAEEDFSFRPGHWTWTIINWSHITARCRDLYFQTISRQDWEYAGNMHCGDLRLPIRTECPVYGTKLYDIISPNVFKQHFSKMKTQITVFTLYWQIETYWRNKIYETLNSAFLKQKPFNLVS